MHPPDWLLLYLHLPALECLSKHTFLFLFFFFNDTATTEIYTLSLHDALPIWGYQYAEGGFAAGVTLVQNPQGTPRSEEHTSELQSLTNLVCRLLLEKKNK